MSSSLSLLRWVPLALGVVLVVTGMALTLSRRRARRDWVHTTGVTGGASIRVSDGTFVTFRTADGQEITETPRVSVDIGWYPRGREVPVWYDPARPQRFDTRISPVDDLLGPTLVLVGVAALAVFVALGPTVG